MSFVSPENLRAIQDQILEELEKSPLLCKVEIALRLGIDPDASPVDDRWDPFTQALDNLWHPNPASTEKPVVGSIVNKDIIHSTYDSALYRQYFLLDQTQSLIAAGLLASNFGDPVYTLKQIAADEGFNVEKEMMPRRSLLISGRRVKELTLSRAAGLRILNQQKGE